MIMNVSAYSLVEGLAGRIKNDWAQSRHATVAIAEDPAHALELLSAGRPGGCAVVIFYLSDGARDDVNDVELAAQLRVAIVQTPGLTLRDGRSAPPVLRLVDEMRQWLDCIELEGLLGGGLYYQGMTHIATAAGEALHGYALTYEAIYARQIFVETESESEE